jgi:peptidoglycan glycosyltransferase
MKLGEDAISEQAKKFGFENSFSVPMNAAMSKFPTGMDKAQTAMSAIGQFNVQATALQMAMVGAGIGNDGVVMRLLPAVGRTVPCGRVCIQISA